MRAKPAIKLLYRGSDPANFNANEDYTGTGMGTTDFRWGPAIDEDFLLHCFAVTIIDSAIHAEGYGAEGSALTNGVEFVWKLDGEEIPAGAGVAVQRNREWISAADDVQLVDFSVPTQSMLRCRVAIGEFFKDPDVPRSFNGIGGVLLQGHRGDQVICRLSDDFTFLVSHVFAIRGGRYLDWISKSNQS